MRLFIKAQARKLAELPYNYRYEMHAAILQMINRSSTVYAQFLHDEGYSQGENPWKKHKLFTFSNLRPYPYHHKHGFGFIDVQEISFLFDSIKWENLDHLIHGAFEKTDFYLRFSGGEKQFFTITHVETQPELSFPSKATFSCLSPILATTKLKRNEKITQHSLDYTDPEERDHFERNIFQNLCQKYHTVHGQPFSGDPTFSFRFDHEFVQKRSGKISKLVHLPDARFRAMYAPFTVIGDPELLKIGYCCGFGEKNALGLGMVKMK